MLLLNFLVLISAICSRHMIIPTSLKTILGTDGSISAVNMSGLAKKQKLVQELIPNAFGSLLDLLI